MKRKEHLLVCLMEECAEVQQAVAKGLRFGLDDTHPKQADVTNEKEIVTEFYQLISVMEQLEMEGFITPPTVREVQQIKKQKMEKLKFYMDYSKKERNLIED
ncbi:MAG: hypothetical protein RR554_10090 [Vagococcus sp.]|uniref:hypothetical protein n=1 Tax=Vagococcus sp. TaxID=1933889 RepID=UPI002FC6BF50